MPKVDKIGWYKGRPISEMNREELLEFATWAAKRIWGLEQAEIENEPHRLDMEVRKLLVKHDQS